jgi:hypothetical protein
MAIRNKACKKNQVLFLAIYKKTRYNKSMEEEYCFVAVEFVNDPNVVGTTYWYLCPFIEVTAGDWVVAPLGKHNHEQQGIVRAVRFCADRDAPFPLYYIKNIKKLLKAKEEKHV